MYTGNTGEARNLKHFENIGHRQQTDTDVWGVTATLTLSRSTAMTHGSQLINRILSWSRFPAPWTCLISIFLPTNSWSRYTYWQSPVHFLGKASETAPSQPSHNSKYKIVSGFDGKAGLWTHESCGSPSHCYLVLRSGLYTGRSLWGWLRTCPKSWALDPVVQLCHEENFFYKSEASCVGQIGFELEILHPQPLW